MLEHDNSPEFIKSLDNKYIIAFWWMLLARTLEEKLAKLYRSGQIAGGVYTGKGQEALSSAIGSCLSAKNGDVFAPLIRDQAGRLAFGEPLLDSVQTYLGSAIGPMRGREGNVHRGRPKEGLLSMISHLGSMISVASGVLLANRLKSENNKVAVASIGDGGTSTGSFHEGLNTAAVEKLPIVVVVANNHFAYSTPNNKQFACKNLASRAIGYGINGFKVDGTNLIDCYDTINKAISIARNGGGPQLVVASLLRLSGHGEHDDFPYISEGLKKSKYGQDCLRVSEKYFLKSKLLSKEKYELMKEEAKKQVEATVTKVRKEPKPNCNNEEWNAFSNN